MESSIPLLDTAIGLVFILFLFSALHSGILELLQVYLRSRNHFLKSSLDKVFNDALNENFSEKLFSHPLIHTTKPSPKSIPAYLTAESFANALVGVFLRKSLTAPLRFDEEKKAFVVEKIDPPQSADEVFSRVRREIQNLNSSDTAVLLQEISFTAENLTGLKDALSQWYDGYMVRVSSQYKRAMLRYAILLGVAISVAFNLNVFSVTHELWVNENLRNGIVQQAIAYQSSGDTLLTHPNPDNAQQVVKVAKGMIDDLGFPFGWDNFSANSFWPFMLCVAGWILSGVALAFGSDNWFNILSKLIEVRGIIKPTPKTKP